MLNTFVAPAAGVLGWMGIERWRSGKPSLLGGASGAVAGLVAVTPAAGVSGPLGAMLLGALASAACYSFIAGAKHRLRLDDSLDVFGIHGLGGIVGSIGTAIVALPALGGHGGRALCAGRAARPASRRRAAGDWLVGGGLGDLLLAGPAGRRRCAATRDEEREGLDLSDHGERAYNP